MLFTSFDFIICFLPIVLGVYLLFMRLDLSHLAMPWLALSSLYFYGSNDYRLLILMLMSLLVNFVVGRLYFIRKRRFILFFGVFFNLFLLGYIKYYGFVGEILGLGDVGSSLPLLGISFYTFQQIAWLVDLRKGINFPSFINYIVFISFFPQLIAGPIVHHSEMMPQFTRIIGTGKSSYAKKFLSHFRIGLSIFVIGLFKKVVIADNCALLVTPIFNAASVGMDIGTFSAWAAALAYSMQIYFDFSGYTDMAVGISRMFGIRLPINFFSPYKSRNIIEFWRRWHMTLSRWLRDYVYIPLGGNLKGEARRYINLMITMLVGGLWHGANWSFVVWGGVHGLFLAGNHVWNKYVGLTTGYFGRFLTFFLVVNAWVLFRAGNYMNDFQTAQNVYGAMYSWKIGSQNSTYWFLLLTICIAFFWPNTCELMNKYHPVIQSTKNGNKNFQVISFLPAHIIVQRWRPTMIWGVIVGCLATTYLYTVTRSNAYIEFIYFQF